MDRQLSGGVAIDGEDLVVLSEAAGSDQGATQRRETLMMRRFCGYLEKVFDFGKQIHTFKTLGSVSIRPWRSGGASSFCLCCGTEVSTGWNRTSGNRSAWSD